MKQQKNYMLENKMVSYKKVITIDTCNSLGEHNLVGMKETKPERRVCTAQFRPHKALRGQQQRQEADEWLGGEES